MNNSWNRRRFLKRVAAGCVGIAGATTAGILLRNEGRDEPLVDPEAVQVRNFRTHMGDSSEKLVIANGDPSSATRAAIGALGGMERFVRPGESVVIKPNIGWDRTPAQAANTNPVVISTLVKMCLDAGAATVIVTDHSCNEPRRCFTRSGIWKEASNAGAVVVLPAGHRFRTHDLGGVVLGRMPVLTAAVRADRFINVPVAKHHGMSGFTGGMKNLYGVLGGRRNRLHQRLDDSIADLADFIRPTLTVMDATRVLTRNGPQGGNLGDVRAVDQVIASTDQVAVDAYGCSLIGLKPADLPYLNLAHKRGLGTVDLSKIPREEVS